MAGFGIFDRVKETSTTTGTGNITLAGTSTGFRTFTSVLSTNDQTFYAIVHRTANEWEVGIGTLTGPTTLTRDQIYASSTGSLVSFTAGTKDVFITQPASKQLTPYTQIYYTYPTTDELNGVQVFYRGFGSQNGPGGNYQQLSQSYSDNVDPQYKFTSFQNSLSPLNGSSGMLSQSTEANASNTSNTFSTRLTASSGFFSGISSRQLQQLYYATGITPSISVSSAITNTTFVGIDGTPSFNYWDALPFGGTTFPVHPGAVILGNAETSAPKFYRYDGSAWNAVGGGGGVTQIVAGTGISISPAGGTGVVTISAGAGGGGWWSFKDLTNSGPETIDLPSSWSAVSTPADSLFIFATASAPWGPPSPGGPWASIGNYPYVGTRYALNGTDWPTAATPTNLNNAFAADGYATAWTFNISGDGNTTAYLATLSNSNYTTTPYAGGFSSFGASGSWKGHALVYVYFGPDVTSTVTFPTGATKKASLYDAYNGASIFAVDYTNTAVADIQAYISPLLTAPGPCWIGWVFWYTYT